MWCVVDVVLSRVNFLFLCVDFSSFPFSSIFRDEVNDLLFLGSRDHAKKLGELQTCSSV